ncbi:MAG: ChaN family lipoprotein [Desulfopila sp.]
MNIISARHNHTFRQLVCFIFLLPLLALILSSSSTVAREKKDEIGYALTLAFAMDTQKLFGTARLQIPPGKEITLSLRDVQATGIVVAKTGSTPAVIDHDTLESLHLGPHDKMQEVSISYEKTIRQDHDNIISRDGITLLAGWFPQPSHPVLFTLQADLPEGFTAVTESEQPQTSPNDAAAFFFAQPRRLIHFTAAPFSVNHTTVRDGLKVYTYFFKEDQHLAAGYLKAARGYLRLYEELIGPYPYNHFIIAENQRPTGYGMPSFTLLGRQVIRLPFIKDTSLGHEILHSWFGNSVTVTPRSGNWSEGLTSYLADWYSREQKSEGARNRKENIIKYLSHVTEKSTLPLSSFTSAGHNQPMAQTVRSVGYIKGAFVFHELRTMLGDQLFFQGLKKFYKHFRGGSAGWRDIQTIFEEVSGNPLQRFFKERLQRTEITDIDVSEITVSTSSGQPTLEFLVQQKTAAPFTLDLAFRVASPNHTASFTKKITGIKERITIPLPFLPDTLTLDPKYDVLRKLDAKEHTATLSYFLGPRRATVVVENSDRQIYAPLLQNLGDDNWHIGSSEDIENSELSRNPLVLLGANNGASNILFGPSSDSAPGVTLDARKNPLNKDLQVLQVVSSSTAQMKAVARKLRHYGKYSFLHFNHGTIQEKRIADEVFGKTFIIADPPRAIAATPSLSFADTMEKIKGARIIYIGERHTSTADHHLQHLVMEKLFQENHAITIGMEMFPQNSQAALDSYTSGDGSLDEKGFLKRSRYFSVWQYDYRYYKPILDFARKNTIPVVGLNIDKEIVSSIFRNGSTDKLTQAQRRRLPEVRDLSLPGYYQRLQTMYGIHSRGEHGEGQLAGFIQAQAVWDEVMAQNIAHYLRRNPERQMIVLAGTQHTRKDSGIPPRVKRQLDLPQSVLMTRQSTVVPSPDLADFFFSMEARPLPSAGKIGISLEEREKKGNTSVTIVELNQDSNAGEAGFLPEDTLISIDGYAIRSLEDVNIAMVGASPGESIPVTIQRSSEEAAMRHTLTVTLYAPPPQHGTAMP